MTTSGKPLFFQNDYSVNDSVDAGIDADIDADIDGSIDLEEAADESPEHCARIKIANPQKEYSAGIVASMRIQVSCPEGCDLSGGTLLIGDAEDRVIAEQRLVKFDENYCVSTTDDFDVQIPAEVGEFVWNIIYYPLADESADDDQGDTSQAMDAATETEQNITETELAEDDSLIYSSDDTDIHTAAIDKTEEAFTEAYPLNLHAITEIEYRFTTVPHYTRISIWRDSLDPVTVGEDYTINTDIRCVHGCVLYGQKLSFYQNGELIATTEINETEPPAENPNLVRIHLTAPDKVGMFALECRMEPEGPGILHSMVDNKFFLKTKKPTQCRLNLLALDKRDGSPIECASFLAIPEGGYSSFARADYSGKASIDVPWGKVFVEVKQDDFYVTDETIDIPEGTEEYDLTLVMPWRKPVSDRE